jgi:hypothetical protein
MSAITTDVHAERPKLKLRYKLLNVTQDQLYRLLFGYIGRLSMIAVYYILTQWLRGQHVATTILGQHLDIHLWNVKYRWDHMLSQDINHGGVVQWMSTTHWDAVRHVVRPFLEGLMALLLYQQIGFDPHTYVDRTEKSKPSTVDRFLMRIPLIPSRYKPVTTTQEVTIPFIVLLVGTLLAIPMFLWVLPFVHTILHAGWIAAHINAYPALATRLYAKETDAFVIGVIAGFAVKRITRPVMNDNMLFFCRFWIAMGWKPHVWMPPGMRHTIEELDRRDDSVEYNRAQIALQGRWFGLSVTGATILILAFAAYGYYIIEYIAT